MNWKHYRWLPLFMIPADRMNGPIPDTVNVQHITINVFVKKRARSLTSWHVF